MAGKKAKKKTKKKAKGKTPKKAPTKTRDVYVLTDDNQLRAKLAKKVLAIAGEIHGFEAMATGTHKEGLEFGYTNAEQVFKEYAEKCREHGLWWRCIESKLTITMRAVWAECTFELIDVDTGHSVQFSGIGQGNNGVWAVNSAQTVALKQALLELFMAYWSEPEDKGREEVDYTQTFRAASTPTEVIDQLGAFFDMYKQEKAKADRRKRKEPK